MEIYQFPPYEICYHSHNDGWEIREEAIVRRIGQTDELAAYVGRLCLQSAQEWISKRLTKELDNQKDGA